LANNINGTIDNTNSPIVNYFGSGAVHGIDAPVNFSSLSPSELAVYQPCFNANRFLWPSTFSEAELLPNQDVIPRTEPDSGADRGGFMSVEVSSLCLCAQWYDSYNNLLYTHSFPNIREGGLDNSTYCQKKCNVFVPASSSSSSSDHWYDNSGALAGVIIAGIVVLAVIVFRCYRRWAKNKNSKRPLDQGLLPNEVGPEDESYNTIGIRGTVQSSEYD